MLFFKVFLLKRPSYGPYVFFLFLTYYDGKKFLADIWINSDGEKKKSRKLSCQPNTMLAADYSLTLQIPFDGFFDGLEES